MGGITEAGFPLPPPKEAPENLDKVEKKKSQAELLLSLIEGSNITFFHDTLKTAYAAVGVGGHSETWTVNGSQFKMWLQKMYYDEYNKPIGGDALKNVSGVLTGKAIYDGDTIPLSVRVAKHGDSIFYDLSDKNWQAVQITAGGWSVVSNPPTLFTRYNHQLPQVPPSEGGNVKRILSLINVKSEYHLLFLCWLVSCFVPDIPHAMPIFFGEKGAAKSTSCELIKTIIDPSSLATLTISNDTKTMAVNLQQHYLLPFDNVSKISGDMSDMLCRAITGGAIQQRKLFTDSEDVIFTFKKCLALNGINNVANRADLLDRSLLIELERIPESRRREITEIKADFYSVLPDIMGDIFTILSKAMMIYPNVKLGRLPRLADFTRWGYAIGEAMGGFGGEFIRVYETNRQQQNIEAINSDPVATLIVEFMKNHSQWSGTPTSLYGELVSIAGENNINPRSKAFPQSPAVLIKRINAVKSNLETAGVVFEKSKSGDDRSITLESVK